MSFREPSLITRFTEGDCHILAKHLSEQSGWPMCAFGIPGRIKLDRHAFVRRPDGKILDVQGLCTEQAFRKRWGCPRDHWTINEATWSEFHGWNHEGWFDGSHERAEELAKELLANYGEIG